jgi:hypothetical protein
MTQKENFQMKPMQKFHKKMSMKNVTLTARERSLRELTHLSPARVNSIAVSDPWFVWSSDMTLETI